MTEEQAGAPATGRARWWPQVRAALLLLHLAAVVLAALPAPVGTDRHSAYRTRHAQAELKRVTEQLEGIGVELTPKELEDLLVDTSKQVLTVRKAVLAPFAPYRDLLGTRQGYRMFSGTSRLSDRLHVEVREEGAWRTVFLTRDPEYPWLRSALDHELGRSMLYRYSEPRYRKRYRAFAAWLARRAAVDFPAADRLRVGWIPTRAPSPAAARAGIPRADDEPRWVRTLPLDELREGR